MRFASQLVKKQIYLTLKMKAASSWELLVELYVPYTVSQRVRTPFFFHV
jgi:hypothetical protein